MPKSYIAAYNEAVFETDKQAALDVVNQALNDGFSPEDVVFKLIIPDGAHRKRSGFQSSSAFHDRPNRRRRNRKNAGKIQRAA